MVFKTKIQLGTHALAFLEAIAILFWSITLLQTKSTYIPYLLYSLLGISSVVFCRKSNFTLNRKEFWFVVMVSALFSVATAMGNYNIFTPLLSNSPQLAISLLGGFVAAKSILTVAIKKLPLGQVESKAAPHSGSWKVFWLCFGLFSLINLLFLFLAVYPGLVTPDSVDQINQALHGYRSNHHPFWHTVIISALLHFGMSVFGNINAGIACYSIALIFFMATCFSYSISTLHRAGLPKKFLIILALFYGVMPYNIAFSVTMFKDVVFGGAALLLVTVLFRVFKNIGNKHANFIGLFFSGIAFCVWRTNGWLAFVGFAAILSIYTILSKEKRLLRSVVLCLVIVVLSWFMRSPVISMLNIAQPDFVESLSIPVQQVARVVSSDREISQEQTDLLSKIMDLEEVPKLYEGHISDPIKNEIRSKDHQYLVDHKGDYLKLWIQLGLQYPGDYLEAWIDQTKGFYDNGLYNYICLPWIADNNFSAFQDVPDTPIRSLFIKYITAFVDMDFTQPFISVGFHVWILCALFIVNLLRDKKQSLLFVPILLIIGTLLIATPVSGEFRYVYSVFTTLPFLAGATLFRIKEKEPSGSKSS